MVNFRLKAFLSVARNLNFTKAAAEMHISQPAISKHIQELEIAYGVQLFERTGNRVKLTSAGETFASYAGVIMEDYNMLNLQMSLLTGRFSGMLNVGASTTIAQYVLPEIVARFIARFPDVRFTMLTGNSTQIEQALNEKRIDIGLVEGDSRHAGLRYTTWTDDELVLVTDARNQSREFVEASELVNLPLVMRETGSGTLEVIENMLNAHNIKLSQLNILIQLGSTESIKAFVVNCPASYAIVSIAAIAEEVKQNKLKIVEIKGARLTRNFAFVTTQGAQNELAERFLRFLSDNKKL